MDRSPEHAARSSGRGRIGWLVDAVAVAGAFRDNRSLINPSERMAAAVRCNLNGIE